MSHSASATWLRTLRFCDIVGTVVALYLNMTSRHIPRATRALVIARDGEICVYCLATTDLSIDHVVAFARGGSHNLDNLVIACMPCNRSKGASPVATFLIVLGARGLDVDAIAERIFRAIG